MQLSAQDGQAGASSHATNGLRIAESAVQNAERNWQASRTNEQLAVNLARLSFDYADIDSDKKVRAQVASHAIQVCEELLASHPQSAALHYYLAMNAGQLARTKSLGALKLVERMEQEFLRALELDANYDYAGPNRNLGLLYRDAPGWPASIGNRKKSMQHLRQAYQLHPEYPDNILNLAESYAHWGEKAVAEDYLAKYKAALKQAKAKFKGDEWQSSWDDWNSRETILEHKISSVVPNNTAPKRLH